MKALFEPPDGYYERFSTKPVAVMPFDERAPAVAAAYGEGLARILRDADVTILHRGSTALGIAGKGDIEFGVYPAAEDWDRVIARLQAIYGPPGSLETDFARFNHESDGFQIEIILLRDDAARLDRALHSYLRNHPALLLEYEAVKRRSSYSRREYQRQKDAFLRMVVAMIPDDE